MLKPPNALAPPLFAPKFLQAPPCTHCRSSPSASTLRRSVSTSPISSTGTWTTCKKAHGNITNSRMPFRSVHHTAGMRQQVCCRNTLNNAQSRILRVLRPFYSTAPLCMPNCHPPTVAHPVSSADYRCCDCPHFRLPQGVVRVAFRRCVRLPPPFCALPELQGCSHLMPSQSIVRLQWW